MINNQNSWITSQHIAHRGLHNNQIPENSLLAFENAIKNNFAIELDVHLLKDNAIVVFHDDNLKRMTGVDIPIKDLTLKQLKKLNLLNSNQKIPTFDEVLKLVNGKVPILIEIKNDTKVGLLEEKLLECLKNYSGKFAVQSFNPYSLAYFKKHAPNILRGQLAGFFKKEKLSFLKKFVLKRMILNKTVSCPDFVSYEADKLPNKYANKSKNLPILAWTIKNQQQFEKIKNHCDNIIFEEFIPN